MLIGELARRASVTPQTVRYYESLGLLSRPDRTPGGYRHYRENALEELAFVHKAQTLGFSLDEVKQILDLGRAGRAPCASVLAIAEDHLTNVDRRIAQLTELRHELAQAVQRWKNGGVPAQCASTLCGLINEVSDETAPRRHTITARQSAGPINRIAPRRRARA
ncbi:MAG: hypothetical protein ABS36_12605 [Acidobacteria bacterium SCN 69-37]|nr:MAG: hypothetical protein ABS36_12605 [Acidobacteria bacterium SCN 69-37]